MTENLEKRCGIEIGDLVWCNKPEKECAHVNKDRYLLIKYYNIHKGEDMQKMYRECGKKEEK